MVYVIAEAGCNHCGDMNLAQRMIEAAALAGADCVKFQTYQTHLLVGAADIKDFCGRCELWGPDLLRLMECCADNGVDFLSSAFDIPSLHLLADLGVKKLKIPSGQIHNMDYLKCAARLFDGKVAYMSTGMSIERQWKKAFRILQRGRAPGPGFRLVVPMHCVTAYPVPLEQAHMAACREIYNYTPHWGYSDHTMADNICAIMAVALGAEVIEHHFYLDEVDCPDMPASFDILQLSDYIRSMRDAETALGVACHKFIQPCEELYLKRRDETRYSGNEQGKHIKGQDDGVSGSDISGTVSGSPKVPRNLRQ